jgi:hypothetical protein
MAELPERVVEGAFMVAAGPHELAAALFDGFVVGVWAEVGEHLDFGGAEMAGAPAVGDEAVEVLVFDGALRLDFA